ncbi:T9SS type A sorting domain-containing protein [Psychroserpens sp. Hel_I_66]|uniref:T9SS type A sorting domain-containing protein n=1 Tax=Psychroserpens sp. Hel_I_66 TaxID=1250004 RepID=UPI000647CF2C|nr:T9SS type A sorting domain-containing protein [Psychroserpens sp. Hel_I_66]
MKALNYLCIALLFAIPKQSYCSSIVDDNVALTDNQVQRVRLDVTTSTGFVRHLLLAFTPNNAATDGYDYGYDAINSDNYQDDASWMVGNQRCKIQGVGAFDDTKAYPLGIFLSNAGDIQIELTALEHFEESVSVYIYDAFNQTTTSIIDSNFIENMSQGDYNNRFYITFTNTISSIVFMDSTLSSEKVILQTPQINYITSTKTLQINLAQGLNIKDITMYSILGQKVSQWSNMTSNASGTYNISVSHMSKGTYLVSLNTKSGTFNKRLIITK